MSAKDKQRLGIAIGLVVVVIAALYFLLLRPKAAPESAVNVGRGEAAVPERPGVTGAPGAPTELPSRPTAAAPTGVAAAAGAQPPAPYRPDPFVPLLPPPTVTTQVGPRPLADQRLAIYQVGFRPVTPQRLPPIVIAAAQRQERTTGILWNEHVWAIIETKGTTAVVQPGDRVDGNTVRGINPQGIILASKEGKETKVPLLPRAVSAGAAPSPVTAPAGRPTLPAMPTARPLRTPMPTAQAGELGEQQEMLRRVMEQLQRRGERD